MGPLFIQPFFQAQIKENINAGLCVGNPTVTGESLPVYHCMDIF